ncbi:MAG: protein kinase domain-containing protein [Planctomycetaceae bacterium]
MLRRGAGESTSFANATAASCRLSLVRPAMGTLTEEELFAAAIQKPLPERGEFLDRACGADAALRAQVELLLAAHHRPDSLLDEERINVRLGVAIESAATTAIDQPTPEAPGTQIGPYKLLEQIGSGGMGTVYVAEQKTPVRRTVALKLIKPGMDTREVIARFEAERQALAMMNHPHIAKVLDAGETAAGRPYFVMELVKGTPVTDFCDQQKLATRERLKLFITFCQAVQHAHQKGLIHRDIKPSNLLVEVHDVTPVPKVIDFGVAKAIGQQLTDKTLYTGFNHMVGTPLYMSPEQAGQSSLDVDTRSDVYSLGVLLYELLTGHTPFARDTLQKAGLDEMRRLIREVDPPLPSARVGTLKAHDLSTVCDRRQVEPKKLSQQLRGELDWIVMKALEKDRKRRYESASALAADVQRYLNDEPVEACPPSVGYRLRKLTRRHKAALVTTAIVAVAMLVGTAVSVWQAVEAKGARKVADTERRDAVAQRQEAQTQRDEANRQRQTADEQRQLAEDSLKNALAAVDQMLTRVSDERLARIPGTEAVRKQLLEDALKFYEEFLRQRSDDPRLRVEVAEAWLRVHNINSRMHNFTGATAAAEQVVAIAESLLQEHPDDLNYLELLFRGMMPMVIHGWKVPGGGSRAEEGLKRGLALCRRFQEMFPNDYRYQLMEQTLKHDLSNYFKMAGRRAEALNLAREVTASLRELQPKLPNNQSERVLLVWSLHHLGLLEGETNFEEGEKLLLEAESLAEAQIAAYADDLPELSGVDAAFALPCVLQCRADIRRDPAQIAERESLLRRAIALLDAYTASRPDLGLPRNILEKAQLALAKILASSGRDDEAEQSIRQAWNATKSCASSNFGNSGGLKTIYDALHSVLTRLGRAEQANALREEMSAKLERCLQRDPSNLDNLRLLVEFQCKLGRFDAALAAVGAALERNPDDVRPLGLITHTVAACPDEGFRAEIMLLADKTIERTNGSADAHLARGALHLAMGNLEAAQSDFGELRSPESRNESERASFARRVFAIADAEYHGGRFTQALPLLDLSIQWNPADSEVLNHRGDVLLSRGELDKAIADFDESIRRGAWNGADTYRKRALAHFRLAEFSRALADLGHAVKLQPQNASTIRVIPPTDVVACPDASIRTGILALADEMVRQSAGNPESLTARAALHIAMARRGPKRP